MSWNINTARQRIDELMRSVPNVKAEGYVEEYLPRFQRMTEAAQLRGVAFDGKPLFSLDDNEAVIVDGVHVYAKLVDYDDYRLSEEGAETEQSHARALNFLHLHYSACDRVVENCGGQRVDFHDGRMHAVVIEPVGALNEGERVAKAIAITEQLKALANSASQTLRNSDFGSDYRFGIDTGVCVAINSGFGDENEPLFLGSAANHAAKLADGDNAGTYLSDRAEAALRNISISSIQNDFEKFIDERPIYRLNESALPELARIAPTTVLAVERLLDNWQTDITKGASVFNSVPANFVFHAHNLPLNDIKYEDLMPSNSIRMGMVSIFGDLDGYTKYIDSSMNDRQALGNAVRNLHVIRGEWANVLQDDFDGRKVRYIGDCIHGVVAHGNGNTTNEQETVRQAVLCAGGLRSSFEICVNLLPGAEALGLAIGIELGPTPITRLGIRGERSVRVASSVSRTNAENEQQRCNGDETAIGPVAHAASSHDIKALFGPNRALSNLDFDTAAYAAPPTAPASPALVSSESDKDFRAHCEIKH